ncbi:TetR/AcrR family transcriptional regulator [Massilia sp. S19_KUP03_FR1]|uniref:TetR/AcrR family transcriptional regulator n=1 Tax=Massilia sp. S19_KUP03_FR1 TaxID=3025503 RepID=UPI002FCD8A9F
MSTIVKRHTDPERARHRRAQVLDAAAVCFARSGFHGASMAEISKQAGMSAGHIYNYFDNKDAIIMAFVAMRMEHVNDKLLNVSQQADPLEYMVEEIVEIVDEQLDTAIWGMSLEMYAEASRNPVIAAALQAADADARIRLHALIKQGREQRALAADARTVEGRTSAMIAMFNGLPLRTLQDPGLDRANLVEACRVAMRALMMT